MNRAQAFMALGRKRLKDNGIEPTDGALALWLAQLAVQMADATSSGYLRADPESAKPAKPIVEPIE